MAHIKNVRLRKFARFFNNKQTLMHWEKYIELNLFTFSESKTGQYLGYRTSQGNLTYIQ